VSAQDAKVLVVDDDKAVRAALSVNLKKAGLHVTLASNAEEALAVLDQASIDLVLTDVRMPGMGGLELLSKSQHSDVEFVVMTGYGNVEDAISAI